MLNPFKLLDRSPKAAPASQPFPGFQRDPFDAVPVLNERAEVREDRQSCYQVRMRQDPAPGMAAFMARRFGFHRDVRVDLDPQGSFFWSQIDGRQNLHTIEQKIREKFSLAREDSRNATLLFTKMLMLRHLIQLDLGREEGVQEESNHV